jgi:hypothetical protein
MKGYDPLRGPALKKQLPAKPQFFPSMPKQVKAILA